MFTWLYLRNGLIDFHSKNDYSDRRFTEKNLIVQYMYADHQDNLGLKPNEQVYICPYNKRTYAQQINLLGEYRATPRELESYSTSNVYIREYFELLS